MGLFFFPFMGPFMGPFVGPFVCPFVGPFLGPSGSLFVSRHTYEPSDGPPKLSWVRPGGASGIEVGPRRGPRLLVI